MSWDCSDPTGSGGSGLGKVSYLARLQCTQHCFEVPKGLLMRGQNSVNSQAHSGSGVATLMSPGALGTQYSKAHMLSRAQLRAGSLLLDWMHLKSFGKSAPRSLNSHYWDFSIIKHIPAHITLESRGMFVLQGAAHSILCCFPGVQHLLTNEQHPRVEKK